MRRQANLVMGSRKSVVPKLHPWRKAHERTPMDNAMVPPLIMNLKKAVRTADERG
jgi:hypothetical protein